MVLVAGEAVKYTGIVQCLQCVVREEGLWALYRALPPRMLSVVPMVGIQLTVYELVRRQLTALNALKAAREEAAVEEARTALALAEEAAFSGR